MGRTTRSDSDADDAASESQQPGGDLVGVDDDEDDSRESFRAAAAAAEGVVGERGRQRQFSIWLPLEKGGGDRPKTGGNARSVRLIMAV